MEVAEIRGGERLGVGRGKPLSFMEVAEIRSLRSALSDSDHQQRLLCFIEVSRNQVVRGLSNQVVCRAFVT